MDSDSTSDGAAPRPREQRAASAEAAAKALRELHKQKDSLDKRGRPNDPHFSDIDYIARGYIAPTP